MYLWYFERVLQAAAGDSSLRLPYWDYETNGRLPPAYRDANYVDERGETVPNPLRVSARQPSLNSGVSSLTAGVTSTAGAVTARSFEPFSSALEQTPHGAVHCAIVTGGCSNGLMGSVPVSALDPIFYAHHTNIDRLYECWLHVNESNRLANDPGQLDTTFTFVDADGSTVERRVADMITTAQLGYSYAGGGGCPAAAVAIASAAESIAMTSVSQQVLATTSATQLQPSSTVVPFTVQPQNREALSARSAAPSQNRTFATIQGVRYDQVPKQNSSGGKERLGSISKAGNRYLRQMLVVGAMAVIRYAERHGTRRPWLVQLMQRRSAKVAAVALANKMARIIWALMTSGERYREPATVSAMAA